MDYMEEENINRIQDANDLIALAIKETRHNNSFSMQLEEVGKKLDDWLSRVIK